MRGATRAALSQSPHYRSLGFASNANQLLHLALSRFKTRYQRCQGACHGHMATQDDHHSALQRLAWLLWRDNLTFSCWWVEPPIPHPGRSQSHSRLRPAVFTSCLQPGHGATQRATQQEQKVGRGQRGSPPVPVPGSCQGLVVVGGGGCPADQPAQDPKGSHDVYTNSTCWVVPQDTNALHSM